MAGALVLCCGGLAALGAIVGPQKSKPAGDVPAARPPVAQSTAPAPRPSSPSPTPSPTKAATAAAVPKPPGNPNGPDREICRLDQDGGTFYAHVTSATAHRFDACAGTTPYQGTLEDLFAQGHGMDRRCILGNAYMLAHEASVGVYSDTKAANLAAAKEFCQANGGTN